MSKANKRNLADRVTEAAETALAVNETVSVIDVLHGIGWLHSGMAQQWRRGQVACLEEFIQSNRISEVLDVFRTWATGRGLIPRETQYVAARPQRQQLRFSKSGDPSIEQAYRTHWASPALSEKARTRLTEKAERPPELVVVQPLNDEWKCHRCGGSGDLLMMENPGPACLSCVGLGDLAFLPAGDALLTRRAKAKSVRYAVVVRFSRTRGRYERKGLLLEPRAIEEAQREMEGARR